MIYQLIDLPANMIGFKAPWEVRKEDFDEVVMPCVQKHVEKMGHINYLLVLNTAMSNYTMCTWIKDALIALKSKARWTRAAIVSDSKSIRTFTQLFGYVIPGEFRGFSHDDFQQAIEWVSEADRQKFAV